MLHTFETRLKADPALDALLATQTAHWCWGLRNTWSFLYRLGLTATDAYVELTGLGLTSKQVGSLLICA